MEFEFELNGDCYYSKQFSKQLKYYKARLFGKQITNIVVIKRDEFVEKRRLFRESQPQSEQPQEIQAPQIEKSEPEQPNPLPIEETPQEIDENKEEDIYGDIDEEDW